MIKSNYYNDELGTQITIEEVQKIVKLLKNGKAAGVDGIVNEILRFGGDNMNQVLWQLCKTIFDNEMVPYEWLEVIILPIYKDNDRRE